MNELIFYFRLEFIDDNDIAHYEQDFEFNEKQKALYEVELMNKALSHIPTNAHYSLDLYAYIDNYEDSLTLICKDYQLVHNTYNHLII